jgi:hypothetical protein
MQLRRRQKRYRAPEKHQVKATHDEKTEFVKSLSPADRDALAQFRTKKGAASPDFR